MNGYNFTERVRQVLAFAREEAQSLHHQYVGTEHILLALLRDDAGVATAVLENLDVDADKLRHTVLDILQRGKGAKPSPDLPYTSRAKRVLELAMSEARELDHNYIGTEHLLLGLLAERQGIAAQSLNALGVTLEEARAQTVRLLRTSPATTTQFFAQISGTARVVERFELKPDGARVHRSIKVAVVQAEVSPTLSAGIEKTASLAREAAAGGAQIVVFPETWLPGYPAWLDVSRDVGLWDHDLAKDVFVRHSAESVDVKGEDGAALGKIAAELRVVLVVGVVERVSRGMGMGTLYNAVLTYSSDGKLLNHHRKLMPTFTERLIWGEGDTAGLGAVDTPVARIGGLICWEHWMPLARQALHDSGEDVHAALWPSVKETNLLASRHYAIEGRCFVLAAGSLMRASALPPELPADPDRVRSENDWVLNGGSAIIGPDGSYIAEPVYERETILAAELDLGNIARGHMTLDVSGHYSRRDCFQFKVRGSGRGLGGVS